jgi:hypothetical protein
VLVDTRQHPNGPPAAAAATVPVVCLRLCGLPLRPGLLLLRIITRNMGFNVNGNGSFNPVRSTHHTARTGLSTAPGLSRKCGPCVG